MQIAHTATLAEIKQAYTTLVKEHHPDKKQGIHTERFLQIQDAWATLRDSELREKHNKLLASQQAHQIKAQGEVAEQVTLLDCDLDEQTQQFCYDCRCSGKYQLSAALIAEQVDAASWLVKCNVCSLTISIVNNMA